MHTIAIAAWDGIVAADVTTPAEVFERTRTPGGGPAYQVRLATPRRTVAAGFLSMSGGPGLDALEDADTGVVPGRTDLSGPTSPAVLDALVRAADAGARVVAVCVGAFTLAEAGLLDHRRATTHWAAAPLLAQRHPLVDVDLDELYVDEGSIATSAGAAAAFDLCLHLVRRDLGNAVAAEVARHCVVPLVREGGQAQFMTPHCPAPSDTDLSPVLAWIQQHLDRPLTVDAIAAHALTSTRSLNRRFHRQLGTTPMRWLRTARVRRGQTLLETTDHPIDRIAVQVGYASPSTFRDNFATIVGTSPRRYRAAFHRPD